MQTIVSDSSLLAAAPISDKTKPNSQTSKKQLFTKDSFESNNQYSTKALNQDFAKHVQINVKTNMQSSNDTGPLNADLVDLVKKGERSISRTSNEQKVLKDEFSPILNIKVQKIAPVGSLEQSQNKHEQATMQSAQSNLMFTSFQAENNQDMLINQFSQAPQNEISNGGYQCSHHFVKLQANTDRNSQKNQPRAKSKVLQQCTPQNFKQPIQSCTNVDQVSTFNKQRPSTQQEQYTTAKLNRPNNRANIGHIQQNFNSKRPSVGQFYNYGRESMNNINPAVIANEYVNNRSKTAEGMSRPKMVYNDNSLQKQRINLNLEQSCGVSGYTAPSYEKREHTATGATTNGASDYQGFQPQNSLENFIKIQPKLHHTQTWQTLLPTKISQEVGAPPIGKQIPQSQSEFTNHFEGGVQYFQVNPSIPKTTVNNAGYFQKNQQQTGNKKSKNDLLIIHLNKEFKNVLQGLKDRDSQTVGEICGQLDSLSQISWQISPLQQIFSKLHSHINKLQKKFESNDLTGIRLLESQIDDFKEEQKKANQTINDLKKKLVNQNEFTLRYLTDEKKIESIRNLKEYEKYPSIKELQGPTYTQDYYRQLEYSTTENHLDIINTAANVEIKKGSAMPRDDDNSRQNLEEIGQRQQETLQFLKEHQETQLHIVQDATALTCVKHLVNKLVFKEQCSQTIPNALDKIVDDYEFIQRHLKNDIRISRLELEQQKAVIRKLKFEIEKKAKDNIELQKDLKSNITETKDLEAEVEGMRERMDNQVMNERKYERVIHQLTCDLENQKKASDKEFEKINILQQDKKQLDKEKTRQRDIIFNQTSQMQTLYEEKIKVEEKLEEAMAELAKKPTQLVDGFDSNSFGSFGGKDYSPLIKSASLNDDEFVDLAARLKLFDSMTWTDDSVIKAVADIGRWFSDESHTVGTFFVPQLKDIKNFTVSQIYKRHDTRGKKRVKKSSQLGSTHGSQRGTENFKELVSSGGGDVFEKAGINPKKHKIKNITSRVLHEQDEKIGSKAGGTKWRNKRIDLQNSHQSIDDFQESSETISSDESSQSESNTPKIKKNQVDFGMQTLHPVREGKKSKIVGQDSPFETGYFKQEEEDESKDKLSPDILNKATALFRRTHFFNDLDSYLSKAVGKNGKMSADALAEANAKFANIKVDEEEYKKLKKATPNRPSAHSKYGVTKRTSMLEGYVNSNIKRVDRFARAANTLMTMTDEVEATAYPDQQKFQRTVNTKSQAFQRAKGLLTNPLLAELNSDLPIVKGVSEQIGNSQSFSPVSHDSPPNDINGAVNIKVNNCRNNTDQSFEVTKVETMEGAQVQNNLGISSNNLNGTLKLTEEGQEDNLQKQNSSRQVANQIQHSNTFFGLQNTDRQLEEGQKNAAINQEGKKQTNQDLMTQTPQQNLPPNDSYNDHWCNKNQSHNVNANPHTKPNQFKTSITSSKRVSIQSTSPSQRQTPDLNKKPNSKSPGQLSKYSQFKLLSNGGVEGAVGPRPVGVRRLSHDLSKNNKSGQPNPLDIKQKLGIQQYKQWYLWHHEQANRLQKLIVSQDNSLPQQHQQVMSWLNEELMSPHKEISTQTMAKVVTNSTKKDLSQSEKKKQPQTLILREKSEHYAQTDEVKGLVSLKKLHPFNKDKLIAAQLYMGPYARTSSADAYPNSFGAPTIPATPI